MLMLIDFDEYRNYLVRKESAKATIRGYKTAIRQINEYAEANNVTELSFEFMLEFKNYMLPKYKSSTLNYKIVAYSSYFNFLETVRPGFRASDYKVKRVSVQNKIDRNYLIEEEYDLVYAACQHAETQMLIKLIAESGLRITEAVNLTKKAIIPFEIPITNKGKTRIVGMSDELKDELREFFSDRGDDEPMFKYSQTTYRNHMKHAARASGVDENKVYPHAFRHYFAKDFLKKSKDERALSMLQSILGHSDIKTTMIYLQFNNSELAFAMANRHRTQPLPQPEPPKQAVKQVKKVEQEPQQAQLNLFDNVA